MHVLDNIVQKTTNKRRSVVNKLVDYLTTTKLETGIMIIFWNQTLQRFHLTTASLQSSGQDLNSACAFCKSTYGYIHSLHFTYSDIEKKAIDLTETEEYEQ